MEKSSKELLERGQNKIWLQHYSYQTEKSYIDSIRRYICFHNQQQEITAFLRHLGVKKNVAGSTKNQVLKSLALL
ncbi:phage integrase N-terminal SAM-like domain-containing protein [Nostoc sp. UHCC 0252]|uniref:phage integrase N-terminal SAM-like domain-containing protein n=1 Tax=Nostoc sp. UHCC 0252 TaxID=3110241 RepID=UPI003A4C782F